MNNPLESIESLEGEIASLDPIQPASVLASPVAIAASDGESDGAETFSIVLSRDYFVAEGRPVLKKGETVGWIRSRFGLGARWIADAARNGLCHIDQDG